MKWIFLVCSIWIGCGYAYLPRIDVLPGEIREIVDEVNPLNLLYFNSCITDLGCFYTGPPFYHPTARPITLPPQEPSAKFTLYTPANPEESYNLTTDDESVKNSPFFQNLRTKIIIHGFRSDVTDNKDIRHEMRKAFLDQDRYNVIIVDWTDNNGFPYAQAASNTRTEGAKVAQLVQVLMKNTGIPPESIHIIGHSLGGHIAGYVGERIPNIGRITGLDPAGPFFQDLDPSVRLDTTDALFVDIIHSDGGEFVLNGLGMSNPIGHIDFYPNGGRRQPGCFYASRPDDILGGTVNYTTKFFSNACDHNRANELFLESINNQRCKFLGVRCTNYHDFESGLCPPNRTNINEMGFHVIQMPGAELPVKFFLRTNSFSPYCLEDSISL